MVKYICYNWMPTIADHVLDLSEEYYNSAGAKRLHNKPNFNPYQVRDGDLIFVKTDFIVNGYFQKNYLDKIFRTFNLITGISSYNLGRDGGEIYKEVLNHPFLNKWVCTNPPDIESDKIIPIPIGFQEPHRPGGNQKLLSDIQETSLPFEEKQNLIFLPYHDVTTNPKREKLVNLLSELSFVVAQREKQSLQEYYNSMNKYKFVIGLEGRGPDIHRNYESMLVGSVPINIKNVIQKVFKQHKLSTVFLDSWDQLDEKCFNKILNMQYSEGTNRSFLSLESHIKFIKEKLYARSD